MKTIFEITPSSIDAENCALICELSDEGFSYAIKDEVENRFLGLGIYHYNKITPPAGMPVSLQILFHHKEILSKNFKKVTVAYSFPQSVLIPFSLYDSQKNAEVLNLVHGDLQNNDTVLTDIIAAHSIYNSFRFPSSLYQVIQTQFPHAESMHQYSVLLKQKTPQKDKLSIIFYAGKMVVSLFKDGKCQLINSFNYLTPEDVSYTLLNICKQFEIENTDVEISGLLEKNSALYQEIYKYFAFVEFVALPQGRNYSEAITEHPAHYFSHIFAIELCG